MKQLYAIIILIFLFAGYAKSQETHGTQQSVTTQDEVNSSINIDIAKIKLPPLSVLYENARSTPSIEILEKEKQLQKKLLAKEKRSWMSLILLSEMFRTALPIISARLPTLPLL